MDMKHLPGLATFLLLTGCAVVQLPGTEGKQDWELVKLSGQSGLDALTGNIGTYVCAIDGRRLDGNGRGCPTDLVFLPGRHTLIISSTDTGFGDPERTVTQDFEAGQVWEIDVQSDDSAAGYHAVLRLDHTVSPPAKH